MRKIIGVVFSLVVMLSLSFSSFAETGGENLTDYKNVVETEISGYAHESNGDVNEFGYSVPFKINYNSSYKTNSGCPITVDEFIVIDGIPVLKITIDADRGLDRAAYKITVRCYTSDSEYTDIETEGISSLLSDGIFHMEDEPLAGLEIEDFLKKNKVQSIEVWIDECDYVKK